MQLVSGRVGGGREVETTARCASFYLHEKNIFVKKHKGQAALINMTISLSENDLIEKQGQYQDSNIVSPH